MVKPSKAAQTLDGSADSHVVATRELEAAHARISDPNGEHDGLHRAAREEQPRVDGSSAPLGGGAAD